MDNPFKIEARETALTQAGRSADQMPDLGRQVETVVCLAPSGEPVMALSGYLWAPTVSSVVKLHEPDREAVVARQLYEIVGGSLRSVVYLHDPATA